MQGCNFVCPDRDRGPSLYAAGCLLFFAMAGRLVSGEAAGLLLKLIRLFAGEVSREFTAGLGSVVYYTIFIIVPFSAYIRSHPGTGEAIRVRSLSGRDALLSVGAAAAGLVLMLVLSALWTRLLISAGIPVSEDPGFSADTPGGLLAMLLTLAVLPAVCEEILVRGVIMTACEDKGPVKAVLLSAVWFTALHGRMEGLPVQFACGLILGYLVMRTGTLFSGILFHAAHNVLLILLSYLTRNVSAPDAAAPMDGAAVICLLTAASVCALFAILVAVKKRHPAGELPLGPSRRVERSGWEYVLLTCSACVAAALYITDILGVPFP